MLPVCHVVCFFCVSAGKNGEDLGSDEEQIVQIVFLLYDVANNKTLSVQEFYVRPTSGNDVTETVLKDECKQTTGLTESDVKNGQPLEQVLDELDRFLRNKEIHPDQGGRAFCLCSDGPLHLRMVLHPEAFQKNIAVSPYFYRYYDLRKQFRNFYKPDRSIASLDDMLSFLALSSDHSVAYGIRHCQNMAIILQRLINDGHQFSEPETIMDRLEPGLLGDAIDDDAVVKARGLPWQSSEQDIINFFRGLNVARGGVALCLSPQGRRNGEALVRFESGEQRTLALRRHKHHLGQRYIEVYKATGRDFVSVAGGVNREAQAFLSHQTGTGSQVIVRMRGLPYSCKAEQVIQFFGSGSSPVEVLDGEDGVLFVHQADGRATGDAFVLFSSEEEANRALTKHKQLIGTRYIELFKSTTAEVQQVLNRSMDPRSTSIYEPKDAALIAAALLPSFALPSPAAAVAAPQPPQLLITGGPRKDCIRLRGLPHEAQVGDVIHFLGDVANDVVSQGVHLIYKAEGTPSGEAFIQMMSESAARTAVLTKHNRTMFLLNTKRSIEVIQCSGDEMTVILNNGLSDTIVSPSPFIPGPSAGLATALGAYWVPAGPAAAAPAVVGRGGAVGLQTIKTTGIQSFFSPVLSSPEAILRSTGFLYPAAGGPLPLASPLLPAIDSSPLLPAIAAFPGPVSSSSTLPPHQTGLVPANPLSAFSPPHLFTVQQVSVRQPTPAAVAPNFAAAAAAPGAFQPMVYWCPAGAGVGTGSPGALLNAFYFPMNSTSTSVAVKGLPPNAQVQDVLTFFDGSYEHLPEVQFQRGPDGRPTGDVIVTFLSPTEADRAVSDKNRKIWANRVIEVQNI